VSVPLIKGSTTIGALTLMSDGGVPSFGEADLSLVRALGERAATAIDNAHRHAEAVEARRLRDEMLAVVAHDLRGPLNTIHLVTTLLARKAPTEETQTIALAVRRAEELIRDLLLASKMEAGSLPLDRRPESVASIVGEVYALFSPLAEAKSLRFVADAGDGDGDSARATLDRHRIVQLLSNLVANAIKFTPPEGRVELRSRRDAEHIQFTVSDTGAGIPAAELPHVFDRFWQGSQARHLGTGLGLWISRGIAIAHGGDITVASAVGAGTTFTIVLPRDGECTPASEASRGPKERAIEP